MRKRLLNDKKDQSTKASSSKQKTDEKNDASKNQNEGDQSVSPRYGPMPTFSGQRLWSRSALIFGLMTIVYFSSKNVKESSFGKYDEEISGKAFETKCSNQLESELKNYKSCQIDKCGRILADTIDPTIEFGLSDMANRIFTNIKDESAMFDFFTGILIHDIDTNLFNSKGTNTKVFRSWDSKYFNSAQQQTKYMLSQYFNLNESALRLNTAFFLSITNSGSKKQHFNKLMNHLTQFSSHFSAIIFLSNFGKDFAGGRLIFPDSDSYNRTVEEKKGRVIGFTSGMENQHVFETVKKGRLTALVLGFTCDSKKIIPTIRIPTSSSTS